MKILDIYLKQRTQQHMWVLGKLSSYHHYEGDQWTVEIADGKSSVSHYKLIEAGLNIQVDEVPNLTREKLFHKVDFVAKEMAEKAVKLFFDTLIEEKEKSGEVIRDESQNFNQNTFLRMLDAYMMNFDDKGEPQLPTVFVSPELGEIIKGQLEAWNNDPIMMERFEEIVTRKREEWRDRKAHRKLVE